MQRRDGLITVAVLLVCGAILVLFTDVELAAVRWVNCGPLASPEAKADPNCR
jgi:hypothetical protein